ncbi:MAG: NAD(P)H-hydrate dehydratase, partial [Candidatus Hecatellaceae archaeon]
DLPTGVEASTGRLLGEAVKADLTVTFHRVKAGLLKAEEYVGEIRVAGIGIPPEAEIYAGPGDVRKVRKPRPKDAHKGDFGRLLVVGGSSIYSGAPALAALAALQVGVDLAYVAAPVEAAKAVSAYSPNLITIKLEGESLKARHISKLKPFLERCTAVILGPGLETRGETLKALPKLLRLIESLGKPLLLDADGLKLFARLGVKAETPCILTPHRGEFQLLAGEELPEELWEAAELVKETASRKQATILLKAPVDIISDGEKVRFNRTGNPAMTAGGTGDVLAGIVGGFLAMGIKPFEAAVAGAFLNGAAGDLAYKRKGPHLTATDLLAEIPALIENPMLHLEALKPR